MGAQSLTSFPGGPRAAPETDCVRDFSGSWRRRIPVPPKREGPENRAWAAGQAPGDRFANPRRPRYGSTPEAMTRSQPTLSSRARACVAWFVAFLQLVGALHFALVRHGYSAALGGVVHVHLLSAGTEATPTPASGEATPALSADIPTCGRELCPVATAPHGALPQVELPLAGTVAFGEATLLAERAARSSDSRRLFFRAPKTSPPT